MSYIGNEPTSVAFLTDTFSGNGSTTAFTMQVAPATTSSVLVAITGVVQDPSTYSVIGTTLTFSAAPPTGTSNISVRYLGIPASGVTTTAYRTVTDFTATASQTTFSVPSYTVGYIDVFRNGVRLAAADYTATNGTTVVLANACTVGDVVTTESFYVSSVLNAIPAVAGAVNSTYITDSAVTSAKIADSAVTRAKMGYAGAVLQVVQGVLSAQTSQTSSTMTNIFSASITPSSSTSKVLIICTVPVYVAASASLYATLRRGATDLSSNNLSRGFFQQSPTATWLGSSGITYLDSPATTSSTTYYFAAANATGSGIVYVGQDGTGNCGQIVLLEIAA